MQVCPDLPRETVAVQHWTVLLHLPTVAAWRAAIDAEVQRLSDSQGYRAVLVCSGRRLLADRHSLSFRWTLYSAGGGAHRPLSPPPLPPSPSLPALSFPLYSPFVSPWYVVPTETPDYPCFTASCRSTRRRATAPAVGQGHPSGHPKPAVGYPSPAAAFGPWALRGGRGGQPNMVVLVHGER